MHTTTGTKTTVYGYAILIKKIGIKYKKGINFRK